MKDLIRKLLREDLEYAHANGANIGGTAETTKDSFIIGEDEISNMVKRARDKRLNRINEGLRFDGPLNKPTPGGNPVGNGIYDPELENNIVDFGIGQIGTVNVIDQTFPNAIYLQGGFKATVEKAGYGTRGLQFIFNKLPKIENIILGCYETACPFWMKMGGKKIGEKEMKNGLMDIILVTRKAFDLKIGL